MTIATAMFEQMVETYHYPVMYRQILRYLEASHKKIIVDCTVGMGAHANKLLEKMSAGSLLIGIDKDNDSLNIAREHLKQYSDRIKLVKGDCSTIDKVLSDLQIDAVDAFLFDLGLSTYQLGNARRGFSFLKEGPLDMRLDQDAFVSAYDLINNLSEKELANIFRLFGEERYYKRIAQAVVAARRNEPIATTTQFADIISNIVGNRYRSYKIHPATRTFQALRIAVNRELLALEAGLVKAISLLRSGGRIAVISFHSLEDRIVKHTFRQYAAKGMLRIITKKPEVPDAAEINENPASRSAKLRIAEKCDIE